MAPRLEHRPFLPAATGRPYECPVVLPGALSARQCDAVLDLGASAESELGVLQDAEVRLDDGIRQSQVRWISPSEDSDWLFTRLGHIATKANRRFGFELTGFAEDIQLTSYDAPGSFYTWHLDGLDTGVSHRKLSIVVQLSDPDDYDGAELEFLPTTTDLDEEGRTEYLASISGRGTAIVFPAFEYHRVTPLRSGVRHSLVCWVSGPPFR